MKLTLTNIKKMKTNSTPLQKRVINYIVDEWSNYDDKKHIFTDVLRNRIVYRGRNVDRRRFEVFYFSARLVDVNEKFFVCAFGKLDYLQRIIVGFARIVFRIKRRILFQIFHYSRISYAFRSCHKGRLCRRGYDGTYSQDKSEKN